MQTKRLSRLERDAALESMADGVDVLVIGGGITGAAVAMDAAARGYSVGLIEKSDFASGTSSKSTKLIHGGIRYLPQLDFALVREALVERGLLFKNAPWIVRPLGFVLPLYRWNKRPLGAPVSPPNGIGLDMIVQSGLLMYDLFAGRLNVHRHARLPLSEAHRLAPSLKSDGLNYAFLYYDGQTDDSRLTMAVLRTAAQNGALAANYAEATGFDISDAGRIRSVRARDRISGKALRIPARHVVNAGGVFAQRIEELTGLESQLSVEPAKGVHLVFSRDKIPMTKNAVVLPETDDGRLLFLVPWEGRVVVGTTDTEGGDIDHPRTSQEDVDYLLDHCNRYLNVTLTQADIISTYSGFRPLIKSKDKASSAKLSRSHAVVDGPAGMVSIVGGKLTTWRKMAEDTMDHIGARDGRKRACSTKTMLLDGTLEWPRIEKEIHDGPFGRFVDIRRHLGSAYGANAGELLDLMSKTPDLARRIVPDLPYLMAEVVYACRYEMAMNLDDVLSRRTRLVLEDREQGRGIAREVAGLMAAELGWSEGETERQAAAYLANIPLEYGITPKSENLQEAANHGGKICFSAGSGNDELKGDPIR